MAISAAAAAQTGNPVHATFTFPLGSSELDAAALERLDLLVARLGRSSQRLLIEGHSDSTGSPAGIERVSKLRAERLARLLQERGVPASRVEVRWFAARVPVASNDGEQGRAKNRRADVRLAEQVTPQVVAVASASEPPAGPAPTTEAAPPMKPTTSTEPAPAPVSPVASARAAPPAAAPVAVAPAQAAPPAAAPVAVADAPRRDEAPTLTPSAAPPVNLTAQPALLRPRVVLATAASVVAIAAGATAVGLLVDSASGATALAGAQGQLARTDLVPQSRADWEAHAASLDAAVQGDAIGAGVLGAVAVTAAVTAVVLWVQEATATK